MLKCAHACCTRGVRAFNIPIILLPTRAESAGVCTVTCRRLPTVNCWITASWPHPCSCQMNNVLSTIITESLGKTFWMCVCIFSVWHPCILCGKNCNELSQQHRLIAAHQCPSWPESLVPIFVVWRFLLSDIKIASDLAPALRGLMEKY